MIGQYFYNQSTRNVVVAFGTLFNNIQLTKKDGSGNVIQTMKVPLAYGPKQKWLARLTEDPNLSKKVAVTLPRIGFEISGISYDSTRKQNKIIKVKKVADVTDKEQVKSGFMPVPYNVEFELFIMSKSSDDALQIVEQILPTFNPQYTITIKPFATEFPTFKEDIPIIINGVGFSDDFEGTLEQRRTIIYTLDFEMKVCFYGAINTADIIRTGTTNIFLQKEGTADSDVQLERITTVPNPLSTIGLADSDFGFTNTIDLTFDSG